MIRKIHTEIHYQLKIPVLKPGRKKPVEGYFWLYHCINNEDGDRETIFVFDQAGKEIQSGDIKNQVIRYWKMGGMDAVDTILARRSSSHKSPSSYQLSFGDEEV